MNSEAHASVLLLAGALPAGCLTRFIILPCTFNWAVYRLRFALFLTPSSRAEGTSGEGSGTD